MAGSVPSVSASRYPSVVVFDLDYTLWPFWVDTHVDPPFRAHPTKPRQAVDRRGKHIAFFPDVKRVVADLLANNVRIGIASRTSAPPEANALLSLLHIDDRGGVLNEVVTYKEIYPGDKQTHFKRILAAAQAQAASASLTQQQDAAASSHAASAAAGIDFTDLLFFDDEHRNIVSVSSLGVTCVHVDEEEGVSWARYQEGLRAWREAHCAREAQGGRRR